MTLNNPNKRQPRAPLHLCALTLNPHKHPVASPDGTVFEGTTVRQLVRRTGLNPINGQPLSPDSLVPLSISTDPRTSLPRCPILFHSFNQNIKIVAIATSGNVYSFAAVQRLNVQPRNMLDLIDRTPFTLDDIIILFDPQQHVWSTEPQDSAPPSSQKSQPHQINLAPSPLVSSEPVRNMSSEPGRYRLPLPEHSHPSPAPPQQHPPPTHHPPIISTHSLSHSLSPLTDTPTAPSIQPKMESLPNQHQQHYFPTSSAAMNQSNPLHPPSSQPIHSGQPPIRIPASASIHLPAYPTTASPYPSMSRCNQVNTKRIVQKRLEPSPILKKPRLHPTVLPATARPPSTPVTEKKHYASNYFERKRAEEERKAVYKRIRKGRKGKGYVRVVTNIGHLNIELHCDKVPMTCDNFLSLAESKYYDGLRWHRVIPDFIAQTGDPSGTGEGGDSFWGGYFKDEIRTSLMHDNAGVVSMANSGRDTNLSQWFICLDAAPHLDGSHTVFGKVVGGLFVLNKIENEAEMGHPLTVETIEVLVNPIRQIREQMQKARIPQGIPNADNSATTSNSQASSAPSNKRETPNQTREGAPSSLTIGAKHPAIHPQVHLSVPHTMPNRLPQAVHENLPPARTLLSAADVPPKDM